MTSQFLTLALAAEIASKMSLGGTGNPAPGNLPLRG